MSDPTPTDSTPQPPAVAPTTTEPTMPPAPSTTVGADDVSMADAPEQASSPAPVPQAAPSAPSPAPARTGTPSRAQNGDASSRAGSVHPEANANIPSQATAHGDSARMYINSTVTAALLEGMKIIGKEQPPNPLETLGNFLLQKSRERNEPSSSG